MKKLPIKSSASRNSFYFFNILCLQQKNKYLSIKKKSNAGRAKNSSILIRTKGSLLKKYKTIKINFNLRFNKLGIIVSFQFIPFKNKLLSLIYYANGVMTYYLTTDTHILFSYIYLNIFKKIKKIFKRNYFQLLYKIKKLTKVSFLELLPKKTPQYCLSSGTFGKILIIDKIKHLISIRLPSKLIKLFSSNSIVFYGCIAMKEKIKYKNTKSGY